MLKWSRFHAMYAVRNGKILDLDEAREWFDVVQDWDEGVCRQAIENVARRHAADGDTYPTKLGELRAEYEALDANRRRVRHCDPPDDGGREILAYIVVDLDTYTLVTDLNRCRQGHLLAVPWTAYETPPTPNWPTRAEAEKAIQEARS